MSVGRERPRTPQGRAPGSGEDETSDVDVPTDQGPDQNPTGVDVTQPAFQAPDPTIAEPEIPKRDSTGPKVDPRDVAEDPEPGQIIGDYELMVRLGKGGAGSVFRARKRSDQSTVALKVLAASKVKRARIVQRFFDEVRAASAVEHHGLIKILDFIEEEQPRRLAYAMEFVDGESLRERLKREGALDLREAIHIAAEVCDALGALHVAGIIHRDLKPENIMVLKTMPGGIPRVKLLDFGVVKFLPVDKTGAQSPVASGEERPGTFVGTPRYMAPEQAAGGVIDARADLFAVGVLLFEMITGHCPHEGDSLRDVVLAKLKGAPRITMNQAKEILPQELTDVVDACLQLKPNLRPKDARVVAAQLRDATIVLFAVGPVKADESGVPFRPASQVEHATPRPELPTPRGPTSNPNIPLSSVHVHPGGHSQPSQPAGSPGHAQPHASHAPQAPHAQQAHPPHAHAPGHAAHSQPAQPAHHAAAVQINVSPPQKRARWIAMILVIIAAILVLALIIERTLQDDQVVLVVPDGQKPEPKQPSVDRPHTVTIESLPRAAMVRVGGERVGWTPKSVELPAGKTSLDVVVSARGYKDSAFTISRTTAKQIDIELEVDPDAKTSTSAP